MRIKMEPVLCFVLCYSDERFELCSCLFFQFGFQQTGDCPVCETGTFSDSGEITFSYNYFIFPKAVRRQFSLFFSLCMFQGQPRVFNARSVIFHQSLKSVHVWPGKKCVNEPPYLILVVFYVSM